MNHPAIGLALALALAPLPASARSDAPLPEGRAPSVCSAAAVDPAPLVAASEPGSKEIVCCLIDAPEGCLGCGQGASCVYEKIEEHECVYVIYGTKCEDATLCK